MPCEEVLKDPDYPPLGSSSMFNVLSQIIVNHVWWCGLGKRIILLPLDTCTENGPQFVD